MRIFAFILGISIFFSSCSRTMEDSMLDKDLEDGKWDKTRWGKATWK